MTTKQQQRLEKLKQRSVQLASDLLSHRLVYGNSGRKITKQRIETRKITGPNNMGFREGVTVDYNVATKECTYAGAK